LTRRNVSRSSGRSPGFWLIFPCIQMEKERPLLFSNESCVFECIWVLNVVQTAFPSCAKQEMQDSDKYYKEKLQRLTSYSSADCVGLPPTSLFCLRFLTWLAALSTSIQESQRPPDDAKCITTLVSIDRSIMKVKAIAHIQRFFIAEPVRTNRNSASWTDMGRL
jgi:hypothetical protein